MLVREFVRQRNPDARMEDALDRLWPVESRVPVRPVCLFQPESGVPVPPDRLF